LNISGNLTDTGNVTGTSNVTDTGATVQISWVAPSEREDSTPISPAEIAGYRIYYGAAQGDYQYQIEINDAYDNDVDSNDLGLSTGTYYAVITTVDVDGRESAFSEEVTLSI